MLYLLKSKYFSLFNIFFLCPMYTTTLAPAQAHASERWISSLTDICMYVCIVVCVCVCVCVCVISRYWSMLKIHSRMII